MKECLRILPRFVVLETVQNAQTLADQSHSLRFLLPNGCKLPRMRTESRQVDSMCIIHLFQMSSKGAGSVYERLRGKPNRCVTGHSMLSVIAMTIYECLVLVEGQLGFAPFHRALGVPTPHRSPCRYFSIFHVRQKQVCQEFTRLSVPLTFDDKDRVQRCTQKTNR